MKKTGLLFCLLFSLFIFASCSINTSPDVYENANEYNTGNIENCNNEIEKAEIFWTSGEINISESDENTVSGYEITEELKIMQKMRWKIEDKKLTVRYCESGYSGKINERYKVLNLCLPHNVSLNINTVASDVKMNVMSSENIDIKTVSGKIYIESAESENLTLKSVSGEIKINRAFCGNSLCAESVSGDVIVNRAEAENISVNTISGYTELGMYKCQNVNIKSTSGFSLLRLCEGQGARIIFDSESGEFRTTRQYEFDGGYVFGDGKCSVNVDTETGTLKVE